MAEEIIRLTGHTLSPGLGKGIVHIHDDVMTSLDEFYDITEIQIEHEENRFDQAIQDICSELGTLVERVEQEVDEELSTVFEAHIHILQDPTLQEEVKKAIGDELVSASDAVRTVFRRWERRFNAMESETIKHGADDLQDLARRLLSSLAGIDGHALKDIPKDSVLVARRLLPSDTIFLARRGASAVLVEEAGHGSHAALFVREIGIPCISGIPDLLETIPPDALALVDADEAIAIINPSAKQQEKFRVKRDRSEIAKQKALSHSREAAETKDGTEIRVFANVGLAKDSQNAVDNGADGIGLYRIELAYLGRQSPPDLAELTAELEEAIAPAGHLPICIRLLDVGADKHLPFIGPSHELNPALGVRGVRFLLHHKHLLDTQLRTLLRLSSRFDVSILVPMVTLPSDMKAVRDMMLEVAAEENVTPLPKLGAMIETPAAALSASEIAEHADFLSFGTNDLTQYAFAADRENVAVEDYFDDTSLVIIRLIEAAHRDAPDTPISVCGELASHPECTEALLRCGITTLSVVPPMIPSAKEAVRRSTIRTDSEKESRDTHT